MFTVSHTVTVNDVSDTIVKTDFINTIAPPVAGFTHGVLGFRKLDVQFTNTSTNAKSFQWDFGDNSPKSTLTSPSHTYSKAGDYTVTLQAFSETNQKGTAVEKKAIIEVGRFIRRFRFERRVLDKQ